MGMRRTQEHALDHAGQADVIGIAPLAGDETLVLDTANRLALAELGHAAVLSGKTRPILRAAFLGAVLGNDRDSAPAFNPPIAGLQ
jgi:methylmalonyl-CoA mutase cobalamin-binding subunit